MASATPPEYDSDYDAIDQEEDCDPQTTPPNDAPLTVLELMQYALKEVQSFGIDRTAISPMMDNCMRLIQSSPLGECPISCYDDYLKLVPQLRDLVRPLYENEIDCWLPVINHYVSNVFIAIQQEDLNGSA